MAASDSSEEYSEYSENTSTVDLEDGRLGTSSRNDGSCFECLTSCFGLIGSTILLSCVLLLLIIGLVFCCPCICILCCCQGRTVYLDGTDELEADDDTKEDVEKARSAEFQGKLRSFSSQLLPRTNSTASMTKSIDRAMSKMWIPLVSTDYEELEVSPQLEEKRKQMTELRLEKCSNPPSNLFLVVERDHMVEQSLRCLTSVPSEELLASRLSVIFKGGYGVDGGGLARDWVDSLGSKLAAAAENGSGHLKAWPDKTLGPRPHEERFMDLCAIGRLVGLAVWFEIPLPLSLSSVICKFILDVPISPLDVKQLDPDFYQFRILPVCKPGGVAELEAALGEPLTFMSAATELRESQELFSGGSATRVTEHNKQKYIKLLCEYHLCGDMRQQINVFLKGFWDIYPPDALESAELTPRDLSLLISGFPDVNVHDWREHTSHSCSDRNTMVIEWFWEVVEELTNEDRAKLLHFMTGSSRLPARGFAGLSPRLNISVSGDPSHLPQAHTCANNLVLPPYTSKQTMQEKLRIALSNDQGFGFI